MRAMRDIDGDAALRYAFAAAAAAAAICAMPAPCVTRLCHATMFRAAARYAALMRFMDSAKVGARSYRRGERGALRQ